LLATDGITEARQKLERRAEFFGSERVLLTIQEERSRSEGDAAEPLKQIGEAVLDAARAFAGGTFQDDVCLLIARRQ